MNSYPPELLMQLAPVMFVAGLDPPQPASPQSPPKQPDREPFANLTHRLREALLSQRKLALWHPSIPDPQNNYQFHVVIVDKNVRFPPRKFVNPDDPHAPSHSPLSPLTPTSPLYPDGLIAPIWLRKHTTLVPSVFVLFTRLFEHVSSTPRSPLDGPDPQRDHEERRRDEELSTEIALRKKSTSERGIKLTVVLLASRKLLDDPTLDNRLTFIRRNSGLDSRAALFVLSPVSQVELGEFVKSLQQALYEPALEYYTNHSKRIRRKRNRHANQVSSYTNLITPVTRPLRPEGWTVRYEYKMACFAEFRGEAEVALKHYQDSYSTLVIMFGSTAILPPRTKRWAEAKVLVDCINIKICKLYLYNNEHALALSQHSSHMRKFADFSRGWGIGEETFEFWSWLARQHRVLSELLEHGLRSGTLVIPVHLPLPPLPPSASINPGLRLEPYALRGLNPAQALQHPGFYYYSAAKCTEMRRKRFLEAINAESMGLVNPSSFPGFTNEKKVDHLAIILELYTKAYEHFKQSTSETPGRMTLWIAGRIGETYYESGKFDMAIKFFERIAKTYRTEKWGATLRPLLSTWYDCARQLGDVELSIRLLVEMLGHDISEDDDPSALQEDLIAVLQSTVPSSNEDSLVVEVAESHPIFNSRLVFWEPKARVGEPAAFQLWLTAPAQISISLLPITKVVVYAGERPVISVVHDGEAKYNERVDVGEIVVGSTEAGPFKAWLRWDMGQSIVISGFASSQEPLTFLLTKVVLNLHEGAWSIEIPFQINTTSDTPATWLVSANPKRTIPLKADHTRGVVFVERPHQLAIDLSHPSPAYLDEEYPILISITNKDDRPLELALDILLQPCEIDDAVNTIRLGEERSSGLIKEEHIGTLSPGSTISKTMYLFSSGGAGDRTLDISVQSRAIPTDAGQPAEHLHTIVIPTVVPFKTETLVEYRRNPRPTPALGDLTTFESDFWRSGDSGTALLRTSFECSGPWVIEVQNVKLIRKDSRHSSVTYASSDDHVDDFPAEFYPGDQFCCQCMLAIEPLLNEDGVQPISAPAEFLVTWKRVSTEVEHSWTTSRIFLPMLQPPTDGLVAILDVPTTAKLHTPSVMCLIIRNRHPTRSAVISIQLEFPPPNVEDPFIVAGLRSGRLPLLLAGAEHQVTWRIIPVECGEQPIPRIKVVDKRDGSGSNEEAEPEGNQVPIVGMTYGGSETSTILVLP